MLKSARPLSRVLVLFSCLTQKLGAAPSADPQKMLESFPKNFLMGSAISGFQADMGCPQLDPDTCEDRNSDWYQYITNPYFIDNRLLYLSGDSPTKGPGFYELYQDDIQRARRDLGHNSLRVSIEWSRIFPHATYDINGFENLRSMASQEALNYYHGVFDSMRQQGIKPLVTINHYTLPEWIHDALDCNKNLDTCAHKGWADPATIVPEITKYAGFVAEEFGGEVDLWATLNEPLTAVVIPSYLLPSRTRSNPPGLYLHTNTAKLAAKAMIEAHARMYHAIHAADHWDADGDGVAASVGLVSAYSAVHPKSDQSKDIQAARNMSYVINEMFLNATINGQLDENWDGTITDRPDLRGSMDYVGINYYMRINVQEAWIPILKLVSPLMNFDPIKAATDNNYPEGIYEVIADLSRYKLPLLITETGSDAAKDPTAVESWLVRSLAWTRQAISDGYDVRGFYLWTLVDNYEWNLGMNMKFGLYSIDPADPLKVRIPRSGVATYRSITDQWAIPNEALKKFFSF